MKFMTIRQTAATGILAEYALRKMEKTGNLPCIYSGRKCLVNYEALLEQLERDSRTVAERDVV